MADANDEVVVEENWSLQPESEAAQPVNRVLVVQVEPLVLVLVLVLAVIGLERRFEVNVQNSTHQVKFKHR